MSRRWLAPVATLAMGCGGTPAGGNGDNPEPGVPSLPTFAGAVKPVQPTMPPPSCEVLGTPGAVVSTFAIDARPPFLAGGTGETDLVIDARGNAIVRAGAQGFVKLSPTGVVLYARPFGTVVAADATGNLYVAGSFTSTIDVGLGPMEPIGNIDVFVVKLDPDGRAVFARSLGLNGDGVDSIAVAADGRIAISGTAMGTAILDANGEVLLDLAFAGLVAFDGSGDLVVAGSFAGTIDFGDGHVLTTAGATDVDGFVVNVDVNGTFMSSSQLGDAALPVNTPDTVVTTPQQQTIAAVAVNARGEVAILGTFVREMSLFGQTITSVAGLPSGGVAGSFVAKLDGSGELVFAKKLIYFYRYNPAGGVAIDLAGNVVITGNGPSEAYFPYAHAFVRKLDASGDDVWGFENDWNVEGFGIGLALDTCGNAYWADVEHSTALALLAPTLRVLAR